MPLSTPFVIVAMSEGLKPAERYPLPTLVAPTTGLLTEPFSSWKENMSPAAKEMPPRTAMNERVYPAPSYRYFSSIGMPSARGTGLPTSLSWKVMDVVATTVHCLPEMLPVCSTSGPRSRNRILTH